MGFSTDSQPDEFKKFPDRAVAARDGTESVMWNRRDELGGIDLVVGEYAVEIEHDQLDRVGQGSFFLMAVWRSFCFPVL